MPEKSRSELFHELMSSFTPEERAAFDAALNDPIRATDLVKWLNRPDPHGMNWEWLKPSDHVVVDLDQMDEDELQ